MSVSDEKIHIAALNADLARFLAVPVPELVREIFQCSELREHFLRALPLLIDLGFIAEVYEICESVESLLRRSNYAQDQSLESLKTTTAIYLMHMDLSRRRKVEHARSFAQSLLQDKSILNRAQGLSALGLIEVFHGHWHESIPLFQQATDLFQEAQSPELALKAKIRLASALMGTGQTEKVREMLAAAAQECMVLGAHAFIIRLMILGIWGQSCFRLGAEAEGLRLLKEAAKNASLVPTSPAGANAFYQYGYALILGGRAKEACPWLEKAEKRYRVIEPQMAWVTMLLLVRACRETEQFFLGERYAAELLQHRHPPALIEDRIEAAHEIILLDLHCHNLQRAKNQLDAARTLCESEGIAPDKQQTFLTPLEAALDSYSARWQEQQIPLTGKMRTPDALFLDLLEEKITVRFGSEGAKVHGYAPDSLLPYLILFLLRSNIAEQPQCSRSETLAALSETTKSPLNPTLEKRLRRAVNTALDLEIVAEHGHRKSLSLSLRPNLTVAIRSHEGVEFLNR